MSGRKGLKKASSSVCPVSSSHHPFPTRTSHLVLPYPAHHAFLLPPHCSPRCCRDCRPYPHGDEALAADRARRSHLLDRGRPWSHGARGWPGQAAGWLVEQGESRAGVFTLCNQILTSPHSSSRRSSVSRLQRSFSTSPRREHRPVTCRASERLSSTSSADWESRTSTSSSTPSLAAPSPRWRRPLV